MIAIWWWNFELKVWLTYPKSTCHSCCWGHVLMSICKKRENVLKKNDAWEGIDSPGDPFQPFLHNDLLFLITIELVPPADAKLMSVRLEFYADKYFIPLFSMRSSSVWVNSCRDISSFAKRCFPWWSRKLVALTYAFSIMR